MTPFSDEVLLMLLIVGLYLYDSALLLFANEALLTTARRGWKVRFGLREPRIRGRELYVPAPWLLHRPLYRLSWQFDGNSSQAAPQDWDARKSVPAALAFFVWLFAFSLFVLLPLGFFLPAAKILLLAAVVLLYPGIIAALAYLWTHREPLGLTKVQIGKLAFEYLICPPFALNLVRAISLARPISEDLIAAARRLESPDDWKRTRDELLPRLDEEIEMEQDEASPRMAALRAHRAALTTESSSN